MNGKYTPEQHMPNKLEEQWKQTWLIRHEITKTKPTPINKNKKKSNTSSTNMRREIKKLS